MSSVLANSNKVPVYLPDYVSLISSQSIHILPSLELESGVVLEQVPIAYKTWGKLNDAKDNVMVICHAFTGSADVEDWWGPLMGIGKAFDPSRFFIFCANVMGSPYGSASPVTRNPATDLPYGPEFPLTSIRDDVRAHKLVLDHLGVASVAVVVGGSMGGMAVLEWPLCAPKGYVRHIIPIATSARHSAWCISWSEAQRQSIYSDPSYDSGYYYFTPSGDSSGINGPKNGLAAARMAALLTYRSRDSFEGRFGRKPQIYTPPATIPVTPAKLGGRVGGLPPTPPKSPSISSLKALAAHNEGNRNSNPNTPVPPTPEERNSPTTPTAPTADSTDSRPSIETRPSGTKVFSAQSYLRYQGDKFTSRFDANCYIHITRKMDTHDVGRDRSGVEENSPVALAQALSTLPKGALVIGVETDGLFTPSEQMELAEYIPEAELVMIKSKDGHDGFLLEFEQINSHILRFLHKFLHDLYAADVQVDDQLKESFEITKTSTFGEAEVDVAMW
ncbi:homoserine O-acetyltransferase [Serendipita vermifera]|nr:homoserine O-acetyltransferase [Serendipita vermifera]